MFRLLLERDLQSDTLDELIEKLGKIKKTLETKKACYITGMEPELTEEFDFGWTLIGSENQDLSFLDAEADPEAGMIAYMLEDLDEDFVDEDDDTVLDYDEDGEDF